LSCDEQPIVKFMIGGAQKCGTTALASYLARHPSILLPKNKEAHVFDARAFDEDADVATINRLFLDHFQGAAEGRLAGDATPITLMYPRALERVARYNPEMRWILLFRDPVERTLSHYAMSRRRGAEKLPLLLAVTLEQWRLNMQSRTPRDHSLRKHSYVQRGRYAAQLDRLFSLFPRENVLLLKSADLWADPVGSVQRACAFLGIGPVQDRGDFPPMFVGNYAVPPAWTPGMLALRFRLRREISKLARHGLDLAGK
jgi:hypothetical protein